jgi:DNA polymerase III, delta subunit
MEGMVVNLDVEWLLCPTSFEGVLIYRYRSGILRRRLLQHVRELAQRSSAEITYCDAAEAKALWSVPGLFDEIRICDVSGQSNKAIQNLLALAIVAPAAPTAILMPASFSRFDPPAGILCVEEPYVTKSNIGKVVQFLVETSDLISLDLKLRKDALNSHLRRWIEGRGKALLPEAMQEFDHVVLNLCDPGYHESTVTADQGVEVTARSRLVASLRCFLASEGAFVLSDLLQALAIKKERGWNSPDLVDDLVQASLRVAETSVSASVAPNSPNSRGRKRLSGSVVVAEEVALLWSALLLAWSHSFASDQVDLGQVEVLVEFEHLCRDFRRRLEDLAGDPLSGCWTRLSGVFRAISNIDESERVDQDPRKDMLRLISCKNRDCRGYPWMEKLHRTALRALSFQEDAAPKTLELEQLIADIDLESFAAVMGQKHLIQELRERFESGRHDRPLLLAGPEGSGKRTIARLYAKALLCEANRSDMEPCGRCPPCAAFKEGANLGYIECDLGHPDGLSHVYAVIDKLRYVPHTNRRVVLIKNADRSSDSINVVLKTLEAGAEATSFILLAENEHRIDPAARSRSAACRLRGLRQADARALASRWLPRDYIQSEVVELAALSGRGLPGAILKCCQIVARGGVSTLDHAKELLGIGWGTEILQYWVALVSEDFQSSRALKSLGSMKPEKAISRLRAALCQFSENTEIPEPAFFGLEAELAAIRDTIEKYAVKLGTTRARLWQELAAHWLDEGTIDNEGLATISMATRDILHGRIQFESRTLPIS